MRNARARSGNNALRDARRLLNENGHATTISQSVSVVPGGNYIFSAWVSHDNANSGCTISVYARLYVN